MSTPEKPSAIAKVEVVPVAGHDSMLLNLSGAHGPFFTRNIAIVTDSGFDCGSGCCSTAPLPPLALVSSEPLHPARTIVIASDNQRAT